MIKTSNNSSMQIPDTIIQREHYMSRILPFIEKKIIKVFTGQRRVGKSYILFQIIQYLLKQKKAPHIIYINKEDLVFDGIKTAKDLNDYVLAHMLSTKMNCVFIDEIQEIQSFEKALRSLLLKKNIDIYCTGSNAKLLSGELATLLSGRFIEINIHSLSYSEFLLFHKLKNTEQSLDIFFKYGGLPYLRNLPLKEDVIFEYLKNIYSTIVFRDVIDRYGIRNIRFLERLVYFLADNTGSLFSAKKISDFLKSQQVKLAPNQIQTYIDFLANAFLISKVQRYDVIGKRIFEFSEKYYFENLGLRHAIIGFKPQDKAKVLENVVYNQLIYNGWDVTTGALNKEEIDFVCNKDGEKMYVQVALRLDNENTINREFGNLLKIQDNFVKLVITMDSFSGNSYEGIKHIFIRDFLTS